MEVGTNTGPFLSRTCRFGVIAFWGLRFGSAGGKPFTFDAAVGFRDFGARGSGFWIQVQGLKLSV